jgi:hypothetical protein
MAIRGVPPKREAAPRDPRIVHNGPTLTISRRQHGDSGERRQQP